MVCGIVFCVLCTMEDCAGKKISRWLLAAGIAVGILAAGYRLFRGSESWYGIFLAVLPGITLLGFSAVTERKIGRGDADMALALGLFLGWELCVSILCAAFLLAAGAAGAGLMLKKLTKNSRLPFAPFLLAALTLVWIFSEGGL